MFSFGNFKPPLSCFFKLILEPQLDLQKLEIPRNFMATYGAEFSNIIHLTVPTGDEWKTILVRQNGQAFLQNGWPEFGGFYRLSFEHRLMFNYEGNSNFNVVIFDKSGVEIIYPCRDCPSKKRKYTKGKEPSAPKKAYGTARGFTSDEIDRVNAYTTNQCKHCSFAKKMQRSFIKYNNPMIIPTDFVENYLDKKVCNRMFELQTDHIVGKPWQVRISCSNSVVKFDKGWTKFVAGNNLQVGDICIFELISESEFKVCILRADTAGVE